MRKANENTVEAVIFVPSNDHNRHHHDEYFIVTNEGMTEKWRKDKSIPIIDVVQSFDIYERNGGGNEGEIVHAKKNQLKDVFNNDNETDIIQRILNEGHIMSTHTDRLHGSIFGKQKAPPFRDNRCFKKPIVSSR